MAKTKEVIDGAECSVETGLGTVVKIEHEEGKRNAHVTIDAEHLRQPVKAWADMEDHRLTGPLLAALDQKLRVAYRIVVKRKKNIDPELPLDKVTTFDRVRDLVSVEPGVAPASTNGSSSPPQAAQDAPAPPRAANGAGAAPSAPPGPPMATCGVCSFGLSTDGSAVTLPDGSQVHAECASQVTTSSGGRRLMQEGKPWEALNPDGSPNLGSYQAQASIGMVGMAHKLLIEHRTRTGEATMPTPGQVRSLAHVLLAAADVAQASLRSDHQVDRMAQSHARARGLVHTALEAFPVPWGAGDAERAQWASQLGAYTIDLLRVAASL